MQEKKDEYYSLNDLLTRVKLFTTFLLKRWWLILLITCIGAAFGAFYFSIQKPKYEGVCSFILEEKQSGMGGLSSIASQFGFDVGGISGGGIFSGDNILDIFKSKKIIQQVLLSKVDSSAIKSQTLADLYMDFTKMKSKWDDRSDLKAINFSDSVKLSTVGDSVLNIIYKNIIKKNLAAERINKKGTIIKVQVTSESNVFSKLMTERLVQEAGKMYLLIKVGTAQNNIDRMQRRSDSLLALLNNKSYVAAASQLLDANPGLRTASVPVEIATRDKSVIAALYTEVTKNLEVSKLLLSQQTPVIQLLDMPGASMDDNKKSRLFLIVVFAFVSMIFSIAVLGLFYFIKIKKITLLHN